MSDLATFVAILLLITIVESSALVRLPIGLLLAIAMLTSDVDLLPVALLGAGGVMLARLALALAARTGHDKLRTSSTTARAKRDALQEQLTGSSAYSRLTFLLAALPGVPASFIFPLLGAMRAPLWPALAGTVVGRFPVLVLTTAFFAWAGRLGNPNDSDAAVMLAVFAVLLLAFRSFGLIDWRFRTQTGRWRMREQNVHAVRLTTMLGGIDSEHRAQSDGSEVIEGELLGEEIVAEPREELDPPT